MTGVPEAPEGGGAVGRRRRRPGKAPMLPLPRRGVAGRRIVLQPEEWPAADRAAWARATTPALGLGPKRAAAAAAGWRPTTRRQAELAYGLWLAWLDHTNGGLDSTAAVATPADRATPEQVEAFAAFLRQGGQTGASIGLRLGKLAMALDAIDPAGAKARRWLGRFAAAHHQRLDERTAHALATQVSAGDLLALGQRWMAEGEALAARPRARRGVAGAVRCRDGLMVALQSLVLLRPRSLLALAEGVSLLRGEHGGWRIALAPQQMKAGLAHEAPVPPELAPALQRYLTVHRPRLIASGGDDIDRSGGALWVSARGAPLTPCGAWAAVTRKVEAALGVRVSLHRFRHIGGTTVAIAAPEMMGIMPDVLGHADERPYLQIYDLGTPLAAGRRWQEALAEERGGDAVEGFRRALAAHRRRN